MSTTREREAKTIKKDLGGTAALTPAINAQGLSSFSYARPGEVGYDRYAGSPMRQIAASLSNYEPSIAHAYTKMLDRRIAEDKSAASLFAVENPELTKNMEAWRQAAEKDDRVLNMSPYVKKYIKQEILKSSALGFDAALKDGYVTSGMVNERDPEKILKWGQEFRKQYTEQAGIKGEGKDMDQLDIAENYTAYTTASLDNLLGKHNRDVESQNANLLEQQMFQNISDTLAGKMNPLTGGYNVHIPAERQSYVTDAAQVIMGKAEEMKKLGYSQDRVMGMLGKAVLMGNHSAAVAEGLAQSLTVNINGKPVSLLSQPGIAKGIEALKDKEIERAWQAESRAHTREEWVRQREVRNAMSAGTAYGSQNDDLTRETVVDKLHLCTDETYPEFVRNARAAAQGRYLKPENQIDLGRLKYGIITGTDGLAAVEEGIRTGRIPPSEASTYQNLALTQKAGENTNLSSSIQDIGKTFLSAITGASVEEAGALYMAYSTGRKAPVGVIAEAMSQLPGITTEFESFINEQRAKKGKEDAALTQSEMLLYKQQFIAEKLPASINTLKERYAVEKAATSETAADKKAFSNMMQDRVPTIYDEEQNKWGYTAYNPIKAKAYTSSFNALNTLFPDQIPEQDYRGMHSVQDMLAYAQSHTPGGLSWQNTFFIAVGATPDSLGVTTMQQALDYIPKHFEQMGYKVKPKPTVLIPNDGGPQNQ
ncbi:hypothetical protein [uncultured Bilophila sp.]|uniref:hypothetical protein n=1 Tax=uncultured Bilophila sp. TaxID=529385 RepID=UPI0026DCEBED|nr:hypothetical protein [uncultured Bilophila sp.]